MKPLIGTFALAAILASLLTNTSCASNSSAAERRVTLTVTNKGFQPATVRLKAGQPVRLVITRRTARTCATEIVLKEHGINQPLPLNKPVEVRFTPTKAGTLRYACAMDMISGKLIVQ